MKSSWFLIGMFDEIVWHTQCALIRDSDSEW